MHPVLEQTHTLVHGLLRRDRGWPSSRVLREQARMVHELAPSELRPPEEVLLLPITFEEVQQLFRLFSIIDIAKTKPSGKRRDKSKEGKKKL